MTSKENCKNVYSMLEKQTGSLIGRMTSRPVMDETEIKGITDFWKGVTSAMETECNCKSLSKVGKAVEKALKTYEQGTKIPGKRGLNKRTSAVMKMGSAAVNLSNTAKRCKLR